jgi:hypothetical protein
VQAPHSRASAPNTGLYDIMAMSVALNSISMAPAAPNPAPITLTLAVLLHAVSQVLLSCALAGVLPSWVTGYASHAHIASIAALATAASALVVLQFVEPVAVAQARVVRAWHGTRVGRWIAAATRSGATVLDAVLKPPPPGTASQPLEGAW